MMLKTLVQGILISGVLCSAVQAEYRVALLIDNSQHQGKSRTLPPPDIKALTGSLQSRQGFRCTVVTNLNGKELKQTIEQFAASTPVRSTALVYFAGPVQQTSTNGQTKVTLLGGQSGNQGYDLAAALDTLHTQGGSHNQMLILDDVAPARPILELPENCLCAWARAETLQSEADLLKALHSQADHVLSRLAPEFSVAGPGSRAIAPPEKFAPGRQIGDEWVNSRGMVFCWCPPGRYSMGSPLTEADRYPDEEHRDVTIPEGFWISKYEVSQGQWRGNRHRESLAVDKLHPVNMASQSKDIKAREIKPLNQTEWQTGHLLPDWEYALPTEEEWEYAARAGTTTSYYFGNDVNLLPQHANFSDRSHYDTQSVYSNSAHRTLNDGSGGLAKVGSFRPNPWGLHDIYGNVAEWCDNAVVRGGSWVSTPASCRSASRDVRGDREQEQYIGCRLVIRKRREQNR